MRIARSTRRTPPREQRQRSVTVPPDFKVSRTEKRSAELLLEMQREDGMDIDPRLEAIAAAPVKRRMLTDAEKVDEMENTLSTLRGMAAEAPDALKPGLTAAWEMMRATLDGELG